jgi:hypothetical protein
MKKIVILFALIFVTMVAACQTKDHKFDVLVRFNQGIQFGDGTIQTTATTGVGTVTWDAITGKPATFTPSAHTQAWSTITSRPTTLSGYGITDAAALNHNHNTLYRPISWVPTWNDVLGKPIFSAVATTGSYNDLIEKPETIELEAALPTLMGIKLPVLTQTQINALVPVKGLILYNDTDGVLQIYTGSVWKVLATTND